MALTLNNLVENSDLQPTDNPVLQGNFRPVEKENTFETLEVIGEIPPALRGTLLRTGPNPVNPGPKHHWFVGDGMLHAIKLDAGSAMGYRNRWIRTKALEAKTGMKAAAGSQIELMVQGSGNVNVISHAGHVLALSEIGLPYEMDTALTTNGLYDYGGSLQSNMTAHPKIDGRTGELLFFGYELLAPFLRYHEVSPAGVLNKSIQIDLPEAVMMHDFGVTETRVIFMDLPVIGDLTMIAEGYSFPFRWDDNHQARLGVMDRSSTTDQVKWIDIDPCFVFHPLNSYDEGDKIVMDVVRYEKVMAESANYNQGSQLVRWLIDPAAGTVETSVLSDLDQEFPRVNPRVECHKHRYGYSLSVGGKQSFSNLLKFDLEAGTTEVYEVGANCAGGEPIFVPATEHGAEDEGYILSVIYNGDTDLSELHIIDAQKFAAKPLAIVKLNARVPFGFHGNFVSA